ncbi:hypothetical protein ACFL0P_03305 [Candidatus Omnitrophota bacterium]
MRHFFGKNILIVILLICGLVVFGYNYAAQNLKSFLSAILEENFDTELSIGHIGLGFPLCLELKDVEIKDSVNIRTVRIYPNPASFLLKNKIIVSMVKIIEPVVRIKSERGKELPVPNFLKKRNVRISSNISAPDFYFSKIHIENGSLIYSNNKENMLEFVKIRGTVGSSGLYFSKDNSFRFSTAGFLKNKDSDFLSPLKIKGYVEVDDTIKARLQANNIKLDALGPIYMEYLDHMLDQGEIELESDIRISKRNLIAKCSLKVEDALFKKELDRKMNPPLVASFILFFNFRNKIVKLKNIQSNFFKFISGQT